MNEMIDEIKIVCKYVEMEGMKLQNTTQQRKQENKIIITVQYER